MDFIIWASKAELADDEVVINSSCGCVSASLRVKVPACGVIKLKVDE